MNNIFQKILLLIISVYSCLNAFEVNTHQALTRCAIASSCSNGSALNLENFVNYAEIKNQSYINEQFEKYKSQNNKDVSYIYYANEGTGFTDWNINVNSNYLGMIEAGSVLEDAVYPQHDFAGDGRFNNHFYAVQFNSKNGCVLSPYMKTSKTLCGGYGTRTDNIDWVLNKNVGLDHGFRNDYGLTDALYYYPKAFVGSASERRRYQAKLFVSLGHVVHMLQDLHSPAHCRGNSHAKGDYLEIYGRYNGGFNLRNGVFNSANNPKITQAIASNGKASSILNNNHYYTYEDFFKKEAQWVGYNFASESHLFFDDIDKNTGAGLHVNNYFDSSSLFDGKNIHPSKGETFESGNIAGLYNWKYVYTDGNVIANSVKGYISPSYRKIGLVKHGLLFDDYHMLAPQYIVESAGAKLKLTYLNQKPLEDTAVNVMPRAVASTQAFINFFFRGQMAVTINSEGILTIKNVSDPQLVSDTRLLTFKSGGKFTIYYDAGTGENKSLTNMTYTFGDIAVGETRTLNLKSYFLDKNLPAGTKITVLYDGDIGTNLGGSDSYGVGMKGLSVDVVNLPTIAKPDYYTASVNGRNEYFPNSSSGTVYFSFDVYIYNNGIYETHIPLNNFLYLGWYSGFAHFHNSNVHHYDIWCQGEYRLCNYLRQTVPADSNVAYENWNIDWNIWASGYNGLNFISNIRRRIGQYYALRYSNQKSKAKMLDMKDEKIQLDLLSNGKEIPLGIDLVSVNRSDVKVEIIESNQTDINH